MSTGFADAVTIPLSSGKSTLFFGDDAFLILLPFVLSTADPTASRPRNEHAFHRPGHSNWFRLNTWPKLTWSSKS